MHGASSPAQNRHRENLICAAHPVSPPRASRAHSPGLSFRTVSQRDRENRGRQNSSALPPP